MWIKVTWDPVEHPHSRRVGILDLRRFVHIRGVGASPLTARLRAGNIGGTDATGTFVSRETSHESVPIERCGEGAFQIHSEIRRCSDAGPPPAGRPGRPAAVDTHSGSVGPTGMGSRCIA
ncbi:hypothetical protein GCM10009776_16830 [Microbacterium deminutum]|uniref:Uncharacterized protein n=1 Tax=Microbacterium deminutum TaxID=344164 RepID=A0ABN2QNP4_9MICO